MTQPYQQSLLRILSGNTPFSDLFKQPLPTSFPLPRIKTMNNTAASSTSTSNSSTQGSKPTPKVYAGYGYRFLREGEAFISGTQVFGEHFQPHTISDNHVGNKVRSASAGIYTAGYYRVPTPAPAGFRLLKADEITTEGDRYFSDDGAYHGVVGSNLGKTAESAAHDVATVHAPFHPSRVTAIIRKEEPKAPALVAPEGYRFLGDHEITEADDRWFSVVFSEVRGPMGSATFIGRSFADFSKTEFNEDKGYWANWRVVRKVEEEPKPAAPVTKQSKPKAKTPVDIAMGNPQRVSLSLANTEFEGQPQPEHVRAEMNQLVLAVESPLREEITNARHGCKRLSEVIDRQRKKIAELESRGDQAHAWEAVFGALYDNLPDVYTAVDRGQCGREQAVDMVKFVAQERVSSARTITQLEEQLRVMKRNSRGNAVLVRRDGFSKPLDISGPGGGFPIHVICGSGETFRETVKQDGFGRTIFEQV